MSPHPGSLGQEVQFSSEPDLKLLVPWPARHQVFLDNLLDVVLRREPPPIDLTSAPSEFWPDVFVHRPMPLAGVLESAAGHVFFIAAVYALLTMLLPRIEARHPKIVLHDKIEFYSLSDYLPPMESASEPAKVARKGEPAAAKQQIISLRPNADNREQRIISPFDVELPVNMKLPNIEAWNRHPAPIVPAAAAQHAVRDLPQTIVPVQVVPPPPEAPAVAKLRVPSDVVNFVEPPPSADSLPVRRLQTGNAAIVEPPPNVDRARLNQRQLAIPNSGVVEPPPSIAHSQFAGRRVNSNPPDVIQPAPAVDPTLAAARTLRDLPVSAPNVVQPAPDANLSRTANANSRQLAQLTPSASPVPPPPDVRPAATVVGPAAGQLIALNLHPADISGPIKVPPGRRQGEFATDPAGKPSAIGVPELKGGGTGSGGPGTTARGNAPPDVLIGSAPIPTPPTPTVQGTVPPSRLAEPAPDRSLMAMARAPSLTDLARHTHSDTPAAPSPIEEKVFAGKKYYSMSLNMPNINSAGGSWIIRFAQLSEDHVRGELAAPVATTKVDPAYPSQMMREHVEGTVVVYAVIRRDGTVAAMRVLKGINDLLDSNALAALSRWRFRPGTKNGEAVDLEAVVQIPFRARGLPF